MVLPPAVVARPGWCRSADWRESSQNVRASAQSSGFRGRENKARRRPGRSTGRRRGICGPDIAAAPRRSSRPWRASRRGISGRRKFPPAPSCRRRRRNKSSRSGGCVMGCASCQSATRCMTPRTACGVMAVELVCARSWKLAARKMAASRRRNVNGIFMGAIIVSCLADVAIQFRRG